MKKRKVPIEKRGGSSVVEIPVATAANPSVTTVITSSFVLILSYFVLNLDSNCTEIVFDYIQI